MPVHWAGVAASGRGSGWDPHAPAEDYRLHQGGAVVRAEHACGSQVGVIRKEIHEKCARSMLVRMRASCHSFVRAPTHTRGTSKLRVLAGGGGGGAPGCCWWVAMGNGEARIHTKTVKTRQKPFPKTVGKLRRSAQKP